MWQKREAEWERERVAREKLMVEVCGQILICGYIQYMGLSGVVRGCIGGICPPPSTRVD